MKYTFACCLVAALPAITTSARAADRPADVCGVLQAVITAEAKGGPVVYPSDVRAITRHLDWPHFSPDFVAAMKITPAERQDLTAQAARQPQTPFVPPCTWAKPGAVAPTPGTPDVISAFTRPVFSRNRQLAVVEWSHVSGTHSGYGVLYVLRRVTRGWDILALKSWAG